VKVAMFSRFPQDRSAPRGGVEAVTLALVRAISRLDDLDLHVVTLERGRRQVEVARQDGATIHRLPGSRWPQMFDILAGPGRRRLKQYLRQLAPDVVHFHETYGLGIGELPMPCVFTIHGFDHANVRAEKGYLAWLRAPLWRRIQEWGLSRQRHIISITPYVKEYIRPLTQATIYDIDNPVDPACFAVEHREVPGRVFSAGWVTHRKNTLGLVMAFARVVRSGVDASLHVAGEQREPAYAEKVKETIGELGLTDHIVLLGRIGPDAIRKELGEASVFALPSRQENAPMAIAEAMAVGVPVISSNRCGMPYMVQEGETGFLVDPEDCGTLAARIRQMLTDKPLRAKMAGAARRVAESRFHSDSVARKTVEVYREIVSRSA